MESFVQLVLLVLVVMIVSSYVWFADNVAHRGEMIEFHGVKILDLNKKQNHAFFSAKQRVSTAKKIGSSMPKISVKKPQKTQKIKKTKPAFDPLLTTLHNKGQFYWLAILRNRMEHRNITPKDLEVKDVISEETIQRILENKHSNNRRESTWRGLIQTLLINKVFENSIEILDWLLIDPVFPERNQCLDLAINVRANKNAKHDDQIDPVEKAKSEGWWTRYPPTISTKNFLNRNTVEQDIIHSIRSLKFTQVIPTYKVIICHGIAGSGKTTLLQHLCTNKNIQDIFADGIFWLGPNLRTKREVLLSLKNQLIPDQSGFLFDSQVPVETWEKWIAQKDRRALIVIDTPEMEILETVLRINSKRIQFVILTTDHHAVFRTASSFFQRDEIKLEQIGFSDLEESVIEWMQQKKSDESLPGSVRKNLKESLPEILEWCGRASYLPGIVRFILETSLQKAWGYSDVMLTPETVGFKEITTKILEPLPISEIVLLEQLLNQIRYGDFNLELAQKVLPKETDLQTILHSWKLRGFLFSNINSPNEKETYYFLSVLVESADLAKKHKESIQDWINLYRINRVKNDLDEIEAKQTALQKI